MIDEIQQMPELFAHLRVIVDDPMCKARFLVTGSASPSLLEQTAETLAGRVKLIEINGLNLGETGVQRWEQLWVRGGFPRAFLAENDDAARDWIENFLKTYVMRDIQRLAGGRLSPQVLAKFLMLLAHYHGQAWNQAQAAASLSVDVKTVQRYVEILEGAYLIRLLPPFEKNVGKRIRKSQRIYFRDSGVLHRLLRIRDAAELRNHDRLGASWEGFALQQVIETIGVEQDYYFWRTHAGSEVDLIVPTSDKPVGFEFKASTSPSVSKGTHESIRDLDLKKVWVLHPGDKGIAISDSIVTLPITRIAEITQR